jgi:hypothetical protein
MSSAAKTASKDSVYFAPRTRSKKRSESARTQLDGKVSRLSHRPGPGGMGSHSREVQPA